MPVYSIVNMLQTIWSPTIRNFRNCTIVSRDKGFLVYLVDPCGRNKLLISTSYPQLISIRLFISASKITDQLITSNSDNPHKNYKYSNLHYIEIKSRLTY